MYVLSVRVLFFLRWGKYSLSAICHIWVSTGTASGLFNDIKQTQSATLAPTPGKETNPVKATKNYLNHIIKDKPYFLQKRHIQNLLHLIQNDFLNEWIQIFSKPLKNSCSRLFWGQISSYHFQQIANRVVKEIQLHGMVTDLLKCSPPFFTEILPPLIYERNTKESFSDIH